MISYAPWVHPRFRSRRHSLNKVRLAPRGRARLSAN